MTDDTDAILARLPARLKEARQAQGLNLDAVAKLSGVSRSMVSQIERGESSPTIATLWNLTRALQVDFAGLLEDSGAGGIEVLRAKDVPSITVGLRGLTYLDVKVTTARADMHSGLFGGAVLNPINTN